MGRSPRQYRILAGVVGRRPIALKVELQRGQGQVLKVSLVGARDPALLHALRHRQRGGKLDRLRRLRNAMR